MSEGPGRGYHAVAYVMALLIVALAAYGVFALIDSLGGIGCD